MIIRAWFLVTLLLASPAMAERVGIAAVVNDDIITSTDVAERRDLIMATAGIPPTIENQQRLIPQVISTLVDETLQSQEAKRLSITISKKEIDDSIAALEKTRNHPPGHIRAFMKEHQLSARTLESQLRAQLAWNKVVQRKLRRAVSISTDEVARAQAAEAAAPGEEEVRIAAISLLLSKPEDEQPMAQLASQLAAELAKGTDLSVLAQQLQNRKDVRINPPRWVPESGLQPAMAQAIRGLKEGEVTPPLKSMNTFQVVQLFERRIVKALPDTTEVAIKEISFKLPATPDERSMAALREQTLAARANPGSCTDMELGTPSPQAQVRFIRGTLGTMAPGLRPVISQLGVTEVSDPLASEDAIRLFMLCEKIEPSAGNLPPAEEVRQELFAEKIELESQKHLRNLKRDAFIEIKGQ